MFILCKGELTKEPYRIPVSEFPVYSLEELCYYIYHNIYTVTEEFFDETLVRWLKEQAGCELLSRKLHGLRKKNHDLRDLVVTLLCSCDYYKEEEIVHLVTVMDKIDHLPSYEKNKMKADHYLASGKFGKSLREYKNLLKGSMAEQFSPEEYGDLLHNQAIAQFHVSSFSEAARGFKEAYARNRRKESLDHYLYLLLILGEEELFEKEGISFGKTAEELNGLKQDYTEVQKDVSLETEEESFAEKCKQELRTAYATDGQCR